MSLINTLTKLKDKLITLSVSVYHFKAPSSKKAPYVVWYEDSEYDNAESNNFKSVRLLSGWIDYFTPTELDSVCNEIEALLGGIDGLYWVLSNVSYGDPQNENDNLYHYTWEWRIIDG